MAHFPDLKMEDKTWISASFRSMFTVTVVCIFMFIYLFHFCSIDFQHQLFICSICAASNSSISSACILDDDLLSPTTEEGSETGTLDAATLTSRNNGAMLSSMGTLRHRPSDTLLSASASDDVFLKPQLNRSRYPC